jgi:hypothetical protein
MEGEVRWHHAQTLASGQVAEFKVWAELVRQSLGALHVFLPLRDLGIDGVVHRLVDGSFVAVQVKGRMSLTPAGQVHITVTASSLVDDDALIVATLVDGSELGRMVLVIDEASFRRLAAHDLVDGREYLTAAFGLHLGGESRWARFLVPRELLAARFGRLPTDAPPTSPASGDVKSPAAVDRRYEGFVGEMEVIRRLASSESLALFRPFPDLETVEVLVRHLATRRYLGLQVKTSGFGSAAAEERVYFRRSSFRASASTFICVLGWDRVGRRFVESCLLVPSVDIAGLARVEGEWLVLEVEPGSRRHRKLGRYASELGMLGQTVEKMLGDPPGGTVLPTPSP